MELNLNDYVKIDVPMEDGTTATAYVPKSALTNEKEKKGVFGRIHDWWKSKSTMEKCAILSLGATAIWIGAGTAGSLLTKKADKDTVYLVGGSDPMVDTSGLLDAAPGIDTPIDI